MKRIVLLFSVAFISLTCDQLNGPMITGPGFTFLPAIDVPWTPDQPLVCFGTSLTYGYGAGSKKFGFPGPVGPGGTATGDSSYPFFLQERLKIIVLNKGFAGKKLSYALSVVNDSILARNPALVLVEFGANDFLQDIPSHQSDSLLSLLIETIHRHNAKVVLISFINPEMLSFTGSNGWTSQDSMLALEYYSMYQSVASRFGVLLMDHPLRGVFGERSLMSDALHPNGQGYYRMHENIFHALRNTFDQNAMIK